jgi:hypothetical protein
MAMEPLMGFGEITYFKLYSRTIALFVLWFICSVSQSKSVINVLCYLIGYIFVSVCVQWHSLQQIEIEKDKKGKKQKKIKFKNIQKILKNLQKK